jgi:hypothetical protein
MRLDQMVKEIREGDEFDNTSDSNTVKVNYSVLSKDSVTYEWAGNSGDELKREGAPFLDNVHSISFIFLNKNGIEKPPNEASKVLINLQVDLDGDAKTGGNPDITLNTEVNLRNYGLGEDEDADEEEG